MNKTKLLAAGLSAVLLGTALTGCAETEPALTPVRLNEVVHSIFYAPQYVALELGFFEDEGLNVELSAGQGADKSMTALLSGGADFALLGMEAGLYVRAEGAENPAVAIAQLTQRAGNFLVSRQEEPDFHWTDLVGKEVIGGRAGGMPQMVLEYILQQQGLNPQTDVTVTTNIAFESTAGAFTGGVGDYTVEFEPTATKLVQQGAGYIVASLGEATGPLPYTVYMTTQSYLDKNPETVQKFVNAVYRGQEWVASHSPQEVAEAVLPQFPDSDAETLAQIIERYQQQDTWAPDPVVNPDAYDFFQSILEAGGQLEQRIPYEDMVVTDFAEQAR